MNRYEKVLEFGTHIRSKNYFPMGEFSNGGKLRDRDYSFPLIMM